MVLSGPQEAPRGLGADAMLVTGPPAAEILRIWPSAKNPRFLPSVDQKGNMALSVPVRRWGAKLLMLRTQIAGMMSLWAPCATKAILVPSGEITGGPAVSPRESRTVSAGAVISARMTCLVPLPALSR